MKAPESPTAIRINIAIPPTNPPVVGEMLNPAIIVARLAVSSPIPGGPDLAIHLDIRRSVSKSPKISVTALSNKNSESIRIAPNMKYGLYALFETTSAKDFFSLEKSYRYFNCTSHTIYTLIFS